MTAEEYLAGAILLEESAVHAAKGIVCASDFANPLCRAIFAAALDLLEEGSPIDPVSIRLRANRNGADLSLEYLAELMQITPTAANSIDYARRVEEQARLRRVKDLATQIQMDDTSSADELIMALREGSEAIASGNNMRGLLTPEDTMRRFYNHVVAAGDGIDNFIPSGYTHLDETLGGGFIRGGLYILGARPAVGKTTFAINLADNISGNCLLISLEMTPEQISAKRISRLTALSSARMLSGKVTDEDWRRIAMASTALVDRGVYLNDRYDLTVQQIHLLAQSKPDLRAIIIDYLGLIKPATHGGSVYENTSQISRDLKRMAISLNVPVICLCQLSRSVESREDKRPRLSDLRDSGSIEQDADAVLFLFRPDYYTGEAEDGFASLAVLNVAKNRHGKTGETNFSCWLSSSLFKEVQ